MQLGVFSCPLWLNLSSDFQWQSKSVLWKNVTIDSACNSWGNKDYVSQNLSLKSANGHVLHPRLHLHRQLLGNGPHTIRSPGHYQLQAVQDHQGELSTFYTIFLQTQDTKYVFFSLGKKRTPVAYSIFKDLLSVANNSQIVGWDYTVQCTAYDAARKSMKMVILVMSLKIGTDMR